MLRNYIGYFLFLIPSISFCQDSLLIIQKQITNSSIVDCYANQNALYALAKDGKVYQIDLDNFSLIKADAPYTGASCIGIDRKGVIWAADSFRSIHTLQDTGWKWEKPLAAASIWEFVFDSKNNLIAFTDLGIYISQTEMYYGVNKYRNRYWCMFAMGRFRPSCFYMDKNDNIWIGTNSRMGTEINVFSLKDKSYITSQLKDFSYISRIQNIFGYKDRLFLTDLGIMTGMSRINSYWQDTMIKIHHPEYDTMKVGPSKEAEEYIGGAFFDEKNNQIYYYTNKGLLKSKYNSKTNKLENPEKIFPPHSTWDGYEFQTRDFAIRLKKIFSHNGKIIYLHSEEGIFIYDGRQLYNLK